MKEPFVGISGGNFGNILIKLSDESLDKFINTCHVWRVFEGISKGILRRTFEVISEGILGGMLAETFKEILAKFFLKHFLNDLLK